MGLLYDLIVSQSGAANQDGHAAEGNERSAAEGFSTAVGSALAYHQQTRELLQADRNGRRPLA
ncbi:hypothetical protein [Paenibacillus sp. MMS18-CY102]|uniref:hypothetical protein n=1 Tax=Paenibacillus sp. MMS18-CY102 TaxID=2682849 RepID=UPI0013653B7F|nr:hypothetical protein [Paenibacillus sp. MMS18-CY102]MWC27774.1 hypothetical protein [Paenibacillus sp. MMS18-CY102]